MSDDTRTVCEYRVEGHLARLARAVNTTDAVDVLAAAADTLDALYSLTRLWRGTLLDQVTYDEVCRATHSGRVVGGLTHLRGQAVHNAVVLSDFSDRVAEYLYDHYGCWTWRSVPNTGADELAVMYREAVAEMEVRVTVDQVRHFLSEELPTSLQPS